MVTQLGSVLLQISVMNVPYTLYIAIALPYERASVVLGHVAGVWSSCIIIAKMLYQMKFVQESAFEVHCMVSS